MKFIWTCTTFESENQFFGTLSLGSIINLTVWKSRKPATWCGLISSQYSRGDSYPTSLHSTMRDCEKATAKLNYQLLLTLEIWNGTATNLLCTLFPGSEYPSRLKLWCISISNLSLHLYRFWLQASPFLLINRISCNIYYKSMYSVSK